MIESNDKTSRTTHRFTSYRKHGANTPVQTMPESSIILIGRLIDGTATGIRRNIFLQIEQGIIRASGPIQDLAADDLHAALDLRHCTMTPALVDCSLALARSPSVACPVDQTNAPVDPADRLTMIGRHLDDCHAHGVLGCAENGELVPWLNQLGSRIQALLPELKVAGDSGHFLRIHHAPDIDGSEREGRTFDRKTLKRMLADKGDRKAVVVANGRETVREALELGADAIEQGYGMGRENLEWMARHQVLWIPSLVRAKNMVDGSASGGSICCRFSTRYVAPGTAAPGAEQFWRQTLDDQLNLLNRARMLGVMTAMGTGAGQTGILHGESMAEELKLFLRAGYSLEQAIGCATVIAAHFFAMKRLGPLVPGQPATFLLTRGMVNQLPRKLAYLEGLFIDGRPSPYFRGK